MFTKTPISHRALPITRAVVNNDSTPVVARHNARTGGALSLFSILHSNRLTSYMMLVMMAVLALFTTSCNKDNDGSNGTTPSLHAGVFVINEGNFMASNASLSFYNYKDATVQNGIFASVNNIPLGDVPTSMLIQDNQAFITLSNSGKIYVIDPVTCKLTGKITGLNSPRYIQFISPTKAYVTNVMSSQIDIINPQTLTINGNIPLIPGQFAEQMVLKDGFVYTNLWSYGTHMLKIDANTDKVVDSLKLGIQPMCLQEDAKGNLWTLADGGYDGNPIGFTDPEILCIDPKAMKIIKRFTITKTPETLNYRLIMAVDRNSIYFINKDLYHMSINDTQLPQTPLVTSTAEQNFYTLAVDPFTSHIFMSDAIDYQQPGNILHYDASGTLIDTFKAGIIPGSFAFLR